MLPISQESMDWAREKLDDAIEVLLPRMTWEEFVRIVEEEWEKMFDNYNDFLSRSDS